MLVLYNQFKIPIFSYDSSSILTIQFIFFRFRSLKYDFLQSVDFIDCTFQTAVAFQGLAKDVAILMGSTSTQAAQFATKIFMFEKRIAEVTPEINAMIDPLKSFHRITVAALNSMSNTVSL